MCVWYCVICRLQVTTLNMTDTCRDGMNKSDSCHVTQNILFSHSPLERSSFEASLDLEPALARVAFICWSCLPPDSHTGNILFWSSVCPAAPSCTNPSTSFFFFSGRKRHSAGAFYFKASLNTQKIIEMWESLTGLIVPDNPALAHTHICCVVSCLHDYICLKTGFLLWQEKENYFKNFVWKHKNVSLCRAFSHHFFSCLPFALFFFFFFFTFCSCNEQIAD